MKAHVSRDKDMNKNKSTDELKKELKKATSKNDKVTGKVDDLRKKKKSLKRKVKKRDMKLMKLKSKVGDFLRNGKNITIDNMDEAKEWELLLELIIRRVDR